MVNTFYLNVISVTCLIAGAKFTAKQKRGFFLSLGFRVRSIVAGSHGTGSSRVDALTSKWWKVDRSRGASPSELFSIMANFRRCFPLWGSMDPPPLISPEVFLQTYSEWFSLLYPSFHQLETKLIIIDSRHLQIIILWNLENKEYIK